MKALAEKVQWTHDNLLVWKRKLINDNRFRDLYPTKTTPNEIEDLETEGTVFGEPLQIKSESGYLKDQMVSLILLYA